MARGHSTAADPTSSEPPGSGSRATPSGLHGAPRADDPGDIPDSIASDLAPPRPRDLTVAADSLRPASLIVAMLFVAFAFYNWNKYPPSAARAATGIYDFGLVGYSFQL